jgi:RNA-directed DNA polymerase
VGRLRDELRDQSRAGRGCSLARTVKTLTPLLRGWMQYFRLAQTKGMFEELDGGLRRNLRCILWRQWKWPRSSATRLMQRGLDEARAWASANNGRGPRGMPGQPHARRFPKDFL